MTENKAHTRDYTLFIDESGRFGERELELERTSDRPSSQVCGVVMPGDLTGDWRGHHLPQPLLNIFPIGQEDHAVNLSYAERAGLIERVIRVCEHEGWRLTRIVNNSGISEGDIRVTYTRMVAELIACLYTTLQTENPEVTPRLHLVYAQVLLGKRIEGREYYFYRGEVTRELRHRGEPIMIELESYQDAIAREVMIDLQHGLGLSERDARAACGEIQSASARINPALRLSDLVSNGSYKRGRALRDFGRVRSHLLDYMEPYDYELHPLKSAHLADELATHRALGQALIVTLEHLTYRNLSLQARAQLNETLVELTEDLAHEHSAERAIDLSAIVDAVDDWVQRRRDYSVAETLITKINHSVLDPLERYLSAHNHSLDDLDLTRFKLTSLALANANHNGRLELSQRRCIALDELRARVATRWEAAPTIMLGQLNIAMSYLHTLELERGLEIAEEVCGFYRDLTEMVSAFEGSALLAARPKVAQYGHALGAAMRLERDLCLTRRASGLSIADQLSRGRELATLALSLCTHHEDRARALQQRVHLESIAGELDAAWETLSLSLGDVSTSSGSTRPTRAELQERCLGRLHEVPKREFRFALFHTLRLTLISRIEEAWDKPSDFERALLKLTRDAIPEVLKGLEDDDPAPAILQVWSAWLAHLGDEAGAIGSLRALCELTDEQKGGDALRLLALIAIVETALGLHATGSEKRALELLVMAPHGKDKRPENFQRRLKKLKAPLSSLPALSAWLEELETHVQSWVKAPRTEQVKTQLWRHLERYPK